MGAWNPDSQSWDKQPGWLPRFMERIFRIPNVQRNRSLGWRIWFKAYGGFSQPFPDRAAAEAAKKRIMAGENIKAEFWRATKPAPAYTPQPAPVLTDEPVVLAGVRFKKRGAFRLAESVLPALFHRRSGHALVLREPREVRFFGDEEIAQRGLIINGQRVKDIEPWQDGWHGYFAEALPE